MKKRLSILLVGVAVSALALVGAFAGIVAAQNNDGDSESKSFAERVAELLGISSDDVENAMQQAKDEMHDERTNAKFASLVESGTLTQEEADAIQDWQDAKPEIEYSLTSDSRGFKHGWGREHLEHADGKWGEWFGSADSTEYLVEKGIITQADADALSEWWDSRPTAVDELMPEHGDKRGKFGHGRHGWWKFDFGEKPEETSDETSKINHDA